MKKTIAKVKLVTPCISSGADQKAGEIRSASLRGVLHFWFRVLGGTLPEEQAIFGRIGAQDQIRKSAINVRVKTPSELRTTVKDGKALTGREIDYFLWPLKDQRHTPGSGQRGIVEQGQEFDLILNYTRIKDGGELPVNVLKTALLLGSLGSRSRRCYGSLWPESISADGEEWKPSETMGGFKEQLHELLVGTNITLCCWGSATSWKDAVDLASDIFKKFRCGSPKSGTPTEWGQNDHDVPLHGSGELYRPVFGLPLTQLYSQHGNWQTFESKKNNDRWGSPLHLKIIPLDGKYHVLAIFLNDYVLTEGTPLTVKGKNKGQIIGSARATLSHDLWRELKTVGEPIV